MPADVVLINPAALQTSLREEAVRERYRYAPLGLLSIAGHLMAHGLEVAVVDIFRENIASKRQFLDLLVESSRAPLVVGIASYTETYPDTVRVVSAIREVFPNAKIVLGGPHATFCFDEILAMCPEVDFVVRSEGESTLLELIEHLKYPDGIGLDAIPGLVYREGGLIRVNAARGLITVMDSLPLPPDHLVPESHGPPGDRIFIVMTSRGCPGKCVFCASRALSGSRYRTHSAERIFSEIYGHHGDVPAMSVGIMDDTFLVDKRRLRRFCSFVRESGVDIVWSCKSRVDTLDEETVALISGCGCRSVHVGAESGDDDVLRRIGKGVSVVQILDAVYTLRKYGVRPECSFIIGHHCDTPESIERTVIVARWIRDSGVGVSIIGICTPLPGTPLLNERDEFGLRILTRNWRDYDLNTVVFETEGFTAEELKQAQYHYDVESVSDPDSRLCLSGRSHRQLARLLARYEQRIAALEPTYAERGIDDQESGFRH